jgi:hypothetical protein
LNEAEILLKQVNVDGMDVELQEFCKGLEAEQDRLGA